MIMDSFLNPKRNLTLIRQAIGLAILTELFFLIIAFKDKSYLLYHTDTAPSPVLDWLNSSPGFIWFAIILTLLLSFLFVLNIKIKFIIPMLYLSFNFLWRSNNYTHGGWVAFVSLSLIFFFLYENKKNYLKEYFYLLQSILLIFYVGSATNRFFNENWTNLDVLPNILGSSHYSRFPYAFWDNLSSILSLIIAIIWAIELLSPILLWNQKLKKYFIPAFILFHLCIFVFLKVGFWSLISIVILISFYHYNFSQRKKFFLFSLILFFALPFNPFSLNTLDRIQYGLKNLIGYTGVHIPFGYPFAKLSPTRKYRSCLHVYNKNKSILYKTPIDQCGIDQFIPFREQVHGFFRKSYKGYKSQKNYVRFICSFFELKGINYLAFEIGNEKAQFQYIDQVNCTNLDLTRIDPVDF